MLVEVAIIILFLDAKINGFLKKWALFSQKVHFVRCLKGQKLLLGYCTGKNGTL